MVQKQAHKAYAQQQVFTASPAKLVYLCYENAIGALRDAITAIEKNDLERRWKANTKAIEILNHLWTTLDIEKGGEIAQNLDQLLGFMLSRLPEVDFKNNPQPAHDVIKLLEPIRDAWKELAEKYNAQELAAAAQETQTTAASAEINAKTLQLSQNQPIVPNPQSIEGSAPAPASAPPAAKPSPTYRASVPVKAPVNAAASSVTVSA